MIACTLFRIYVHYITFIYELMDLSLSSQQESVSQLNPQQKKNHHRKEYEKKYGSLKHANGWMNS